MTDSAHHEPVDRRTRRTRTAIVSAFNRLILEQGYASLTPGHLAAAADVGRSTFYSHFKGIDDLLGQSVSALLAPLARGWSEPTPTEEANRMVEHIWENRQLARVLFSEAHEVVLRSFAAQFESSIRRIIHSSGITPILSPDLIALQLAAGQLAVLSAWISGRSGHSASDITIAVHASGRASMLALVKPQHF